MSTVKNAEKYYFSEKGIVEGPFYLEELIKKIKPDTLVFAENGIKWLKAEEIPEIKEALYAITQQLDSDHTLIDISEKDKTPIVTSPISDSTTLANLSEISSGKNRVEINSPTSSRTSASLNTFLITTAVLILLTAFGLFYFFWYTPNLEDKNKIKKYCFIDVLNKRSSKTIDDEFNILGSCKYGEELVIEEEDGTWTTCKLENNVFYVASRYLLNKEDYYLLNSIFSDSDSRSAVAISKCRIALLDYFKQNKYIGNLDLQTQKEVFGNQLNYPVWELKAEKKEIKPNTVYYLFGDSINPQKITDFGCIIKNNASGERRCLIFSFSDSEVPKLEYEAQSPDTRYIESIHKSYDSTGVRYTVNYTD